MAITALLISATAFLAYSNGANDNFKGVATLFGSGTTNYRRAIWWATATTLAGSLCSVFLAGALLKSFSGKGLVPDELAGTPDFALAVTAAGGLTVILATVLGFPISTTHSLMGGLIGSGIVASGTGLGWSALGQKFVAPLLVSPFLAIALTAVLYVILRTLRLRMNVTEEWCMCVGECEQVVPIQQPASALTMHVVNVPEVAVGTETECARRYSGSVMGIRAQSVLDVLHFLSAGAVSFARGLNDTPKIFALLLGLSVLNVHVGLSAVAIAMALGGLLNARRVAETMSMKITTMNHGQGFTANIVTAFLVIGASRMGVPVSTTHVSCGALFGIGSVTRQAQWGSIGKIALSWLLTLPIAAAISGLIFLMIHR